ncbi:MAG: DUF3025 domain-containing protein, partial [Rhodoferax sp.]|nr:DUF3025 domain-containing protein [Rhodoferax sp.]
PQSHLPVGEAYEAFIGRTRHVPTRDGLHDFFNGLCWARFPRAKRRLNTLQSEAIARQGIQPQRGPLRDALTLFDENGAFWDPPAALREALAARQWRRLFQDLRALWQAHPPVLFGHGLLTQLVSPRKPATARVLLIDSATHSGADEAESDRDIRLVAALDQGPLAAARLLPLPVLGVPGWWPANEVPAFYDDAAVFRPRQ